ncbi:MAG: hypothetical protein HY843_02825 [Bdellovibrio sp.]|nr:hypothetical protein [Bdellovibrio sp.]
MVKTGKSPNHPRSNESESKPIQRPKQVDLAGAELLKDEASAVYQLRCAVCIKDINEMNDKVLELLGTLRHERDDNKKSEKTEELKRILDLILVCKKRLECTDTKACALSTDKPCRMQDLMEVHKEYEDVKEESSAIQDKINVFTDLNTPEVKSDQAEVK